MAGAVVEAPKAVVVAAEQQGAAAGKGMAADGQVEQAIHLVEDAAMRPLAVGKSKSDACLT